MTDLLASADIQVNGVRAWDLQVRHESFFKRVFTQGLLGLSEAYMDGWWDVDELDQFICKALSSDLRNQIVRCEHLPLVLLAKFTNMQTLTRAYQVGEQHYNLGHELFECMLDDCMTYTCAFWKKRRI